MKKQELLLKKKQRDSVKKKPKLKHKESLLKRKLKINVLKKKRPKTSE